MDHLKFNSNGKIPALGFGTYKLTGKEGVEAIENALEVGYRHIDTAEDYNNQKEVARAIKNSPFSRNELFITSKVSPDHLHYNDLIRACKTTLRDLNTDYLDLYLIHWPNKNIPLEETMRAMTRLKSDGIVKNIGVSNFSIKLLEEVKKVSEEEIAVNQVEFHPYLYQEELYNYCMDNGINITAYSPIARGKVFGDPVLQEIAEKHGKNEGQVALRWMIQKKIVVIPRSANYDHIKTNFDIFDFLLGDKEMNMIDNIKRQERLINPEWAKF